MTNPDKHPQPEQPNYRLRQFLAGLAVAAAATGAGVGIDKLVNLAGTNTSSAAAEYHPKHGEPMETITVKPGEGAQAVVDSVDPGAENNAEQQSELDKFVEDQGLGQGHELEADQRVDVPVIASDQPDHQIPSGTHPYEG